MISGISKTVDLLRRGLEEQGHHVEVLSRDDYPKYMRDEVRISAFALFWPRLRRQLHGYDVVNVHGPVPTISELFLLFVRSVHHHNRPAIVYTHHSDLAIRSWERWCAVYNKLNRLLSKFADVVVVSSHDYHAKIRHATGPEVTVIPWAVEAAPAVSRPPRSSTSVLPRELKVLFVGQLRSYKGVDVLLDAVAGQHGIRLSIVGAGPMLPQITERIARADMPAVQLLGRLSDADLWQVYLEHDVIALPSTTTAEAYGLVLMEGMAAGCVPLASDLPGVREVASHTGLLVAPGNAMALGAAMQRLLGDPALLAELSAKSLERSKTMSVNVMAGAYADTMHGAIAGNMDRRASAAIPARWQHPEQLLDRLADALAVEQVSLSLMSRHTDAAQAHIWRHRQHGFRADAPVARYIARANRPVLISSTAPLPAELRNLLHRPELSSSILVPVRRTRHTVSVLGLSTNSDERAPFGPDHLHIALRVLASSPAGDSR
ncbi:MAG: hypothetical protein JWN95_199 [Frankiales bacterium]|nr:hypothetical protein [Frankiales bacterium]